ncbi:hypothetical protein TNCV_4830121 [Trichonephila clavipes]|nr:hypothetical protein TNCV_4830121 [Trichonephila clavipes]
MNETTQQEKTTQLGSRNETTQLVSRNETTRLCTAVDRLQPPTTVCNRLQPPTTACTAFTAESAFSTYCRILRRFRIVRAQVHYLWGGYWASKLPAVIGIPPIWCTSKNS